MPAVTLLPGVRVYLEFIEYNGSPEGAGEAYKSLPPECLDNTVIAALPGEPMSMCEAAVGLLHALDSKYRGSRVRSTPILFIMEVLGYRQVRDVVERVRSPDYLVVASISMDCFSTALTLARSLPGAGAPVSVEECDLEGLARRTTASVRRGPRLS